MANSEQEIFRLNKKIKELLAFSEKTFSQNKQYERENTKLKAELDKLRSDFSRASNQNFQFRFDLEKTTLERDNIFSAHQKQKALLSELMRKHNSQFRQLKKLEDIVAKNHDNLLPYAEIYAKRGPVTVIGSIAQLNSDESSDGKVKRLEADIKVLEEELQQSYELIDQLEFEIEEIDYLESENERLQEELNKSRAATNDIDNQNPSHDDTAVYEDENESLSSPHQLVRTEKLVSDKHTRRNLLHKKLETLHQHKRCSLGNTESN
ncbi:hypothetical protein Bhyg_01702 [Pseudolycoriella hygida]|uniref:Uncharacterized protein n=1 Tax=Pseudolycoriella hygida TaxID=35572 RepID=A0A9Q0NBB4_9DIPT|nr:hypothetical protein Bhyg_01702 [Pseudolycoriella hygida]